MRVKTSPMRGSCPLLFEDLRIVGKLNYVKPFVKRVFSLLPNYGKHVISDLPLSTVEFVVTHPAVAHDLGIDLFFKFKNFGYPVSDILNF